MSRRTRQGTMVREVADPRERIAMAESEERWKQALELAKALYKHEPSPESREIVKRATLGRIGQLRKQGHARDAATALENARGLDAGMGWQETMAREMAACGEARRALELIAPFPDSAVLPAILAHVADWSIVHAKEARTALPQELGGQHDAIVRAFAQVEAVQDEEARQSLQEIGLRSPFLDWKMLLRGLMAYYQGDEARALENWGRLDLQRLPARLAAPLRLAIDPAFRQAQPPATQASLRQQADRLQESGLVKPLRELQAVLANERKLAQGFRLVENFLPAFRQNAPQIVKRLASCFYWAIIAHARPDDIPRYERVFGKPEDDPSFSRMEALGLQESGQGRYALDPWRTYEKEIANGIVSWPGKHAGSVRALIWNHVGELALMAQERQAFDSELYPRPGKTPRRDPNEAEAETCFERSLELNPDALEAYERLFLLYMHQGKTDEAIAMGRRLLERFPDHALTLTTLSALLTDRQENAEALAMLQRALKCNPLDRELRQAVALAHMRLAREHAVASEFEEARAHCRQAHSLWVDPENVLLACRWAACEIKAGANDEAENLLRQALARGGTLPVAYCMLIEAIRLKLPRAAKSRFDKDFKAALAAPPTPAGAAGAARIAAAHHSGKVIYAGQKTHEKKIVGYLQTAIAVDFTEEQLENVCRALGALKAKKAALAYVEHGLSKFPAVPFFYLATADSELTSGRGFMRNLNAKRLLDKAQELADRLPQSDKKKKLLDEIRLKRDEMMRLFPDFPGMGELGTVLDAFADMEDELGFGPEDDSSW